MFHKTNLPVFAALCFTLAFSPGARADNDEGSQSNVARAVDNIISSLPSEFTDGVDLGAMSPEQRVNWVMNSLEEKVQEKITEKVQDAIKEKLWDYAEQAIRAQAFMEIGVPQIRHAYAMGEEFDWTSIEAEIASRTDTNLRALSGAIQVAQIGWNTIQSYQQGDFRSAARTLGGEISQLLLQAYIPGFGTFMLGAQATIFLGNYVLDYATDTAIEGMLNNLYGMNSDPGAFAEWLIDQSPADIRRDIDAKFADGMGFGYLYRHQGTDAGEEKMKRRLLDELVEIRGRLALQQREQKRREREFQREVERYLQDYRRAEAELKAAAASVRQEVESQLQPVEELREQLTSLRKRDAQEKAEEIQRDIREMRRETRTAVREDRRSEESRINYVSIPVDSLIGELRTVASQVTSTPSGYNLEAINRMRDSYHSRRSAALRRSESSLPGTEWREDTRDKFQRKYKRERELLSQREREVVLEAQERADRLSESISEELERINEDIRQAREERDAALQAWRQKVERELNFPDWFFNPPSDYISRASREGISWSTLSPDGTLHPYQAGSLHSARNRLKNNIEGIRQDLHEFDRLSNEHRSILESYRNRVLNLRNVFESLVPEDLIVFSERRRDAPRGKERWGMSEGAIGIRASLLDDVGTRFPRVHLMRNQDPSLPSVELQDVLNEEIAEIDNLARLRRNTLRKVLAGMESNLQRIRPYANRDRAMASIVRIFNNVWPVLSRTRNSIAPWQFREKDGEQCYITVSAYQSDGAEAVAEMEKRWNASRRYVTIMAELVEEYGDGLQYRSRVFSPNYYIRWVERFQALPERIAGYKKKMEEIETLRPAKIKEIEDKLEKFTVDIASIKETGTPMTHFGGPSLLRAEMEQILNINIRWDPYWRAYTDELEQLREDMETNLELARQKAVARVEERRRAEEERRRREEEEKRRREEEEERRREERRVAERERQERLNKVKDFYERFASNYSRRDLTAVISMLDSNWSAEDGSTILDLEETLDNSFRVFDEVECQISNIRVTSHEDNVIRVQYTINITGHIYRNRIRHKENSQVTEKVHLDNGRTVILSTLGGRFW